MVGFFLQKAYNIGNIVQEDTLNEQSSPRSL